MARDTEVRRWGGDVPLRAVAGADGGALPAEPEVPAGDRLQATALDVLERLIDATCTRARAALGGGELGVERRAMCSGWRRTYGTWTDSATRKRRARSTRRGRLIGGWTWVVAARLPLFRATGLRWHGVAVVQVERHPR